MIRIGTVPYLVARPLTAALENQSGVEILEAPPATLATYLDEGRVDVALASSILALERTDLLFWEDGPVIASDGPIRSVLLFLRPDLQDPGQVRSFVPDPHSRTGRSLARIVLRDLFGATFEEYSMGKGQSPFNTRADGVQLIGDPAIRACAEHPHWKPVDLGETWRRLTRLPFVYAGWIGRPGFSPQNAASILETAAKEGLENRKSWIEEGVRHFGYPREFVNHYLNEDLCYRLPPGQVRAALNEFQRRLELPSRLLKTQ